jgi:imidazolonepropionase-like amidohydrolase
MTYGGRRFGTGFFIGIALSLAAGASAQSTALVGARLIDGTGQVIEAGTVIVEGNRIVRAGPTASTPIPAGAARLDLTGKTVMPGLVNAHGHVAATRGLQSNPSFYTTDNLIRQLRTYAQYGVTSVFSLGDDEPAGFALRDAQASGPLDRARIFVAGPVITGNTAEAAIAATNKAADMKPDLLKVRVDDNLGTSAKMPEAAWRAAISRAHQRGLRIAAHIFYLDDAKAIVAAGGDLIAHSVRDRPVDAAFVSALKSRDVCYSPTLMREVSTFVYEATPVWANDPFFLKGAEPEIPKLLADPVRQSQFRASSGWKTGQRYKAGLEVAKRNLKALADQGVRIAFGTDTGPPGRFQGFFEQLELELMVEAGLTPMQAIVAATGDAARCHQKGGQLGALAAGGAADLLVLSANPLDNIRNMRTIEQVWIAGKRAF